MSFFNSLHLQLGLTVHIVFLSDLDTIFAKVNFTIVMKDTALWLFYCLI